MNIIYAEYNIHHNSIDKATTVGCLLRIDCWEAEKGLKTIPCSECAFNAHAIDYPPVKPDEAVNGGAKWRLFYR